MRFLIKILISALIIAAVSELARKSPGIGAILAALPMTSILTMLWLYSDTGDTGKVAALSVSIFWAVLPSFIFLLSLPLFLRNGYRFPVAMGLSCSLMIVGYGGYVWILRQAGIAL
jgi:uncharacterized membrane protein (GlpM family)